MSPIDAVVVTLAVFTGAVVTGGVGFGANLVAAPVVVLVDPDFVPGPLLIEVLVLTVLMTVREASHLDRSALGWALLGRVPGVAVGVVVLQALDGDQIGVLFALAVLTAVASSAAGLHVRRTRVTLAGAGALSGVMGTTTSIGGPPMALVMQRAEGPTIRGTLSVFFLIGVTISITTLIASGDIGGHEARLTLWLLPGTLVGFWASGRLRRFLDGAWLRPAILAVSAIGAALVLVRSLW